MVYYFCEFESEHELKIILRSVKGCKVMALAHSRSYLPEIRRDMECYYGVFRSDEMLYYHRFVEGFIADYGIGDYDDIIRAIDKQIFEQSTLLQFPYYSMLEAIKAEFMMVVRAMRIDDILL